MTMLYAMVLAPIINRMYYGPEVITLDPNRRLKSIERDGWSIKGPQSYIEPPKVAENPGGTAGTANSLKPQNLMDELSKSGAKYNPNDVVTVVKTPEGKLMWLENGSSSSGLKHIVDGHAADFARREIDNIPSFLNRVLSETPIKTGMGKAGPYADYFIGDSKYRVVYGSNGYIVTFFPID